MYDSEAELYAALFERTVEDDATAKVLLNNTYGRAGWY